jgi:hypothetical protein
VTGGKQAGRKSIAKIDRYGRPTIPLRHFRNTGGLSRINQNDFI